MGYKVHHTVHSSNTAISYSLVKLKGNLKHHEECEMKLEQIQDRAEQ